MLSRILVPLFLLFTLALSFEIHSNHYRIKFNETRPDIDFLPLPHGDDVFYRLSWKGFREVDENAQLVRYTYFGSNFTYTPITNETNHKGTEVVNTNMTAYVDVDGTITTLKVSHYLYKNRSDNGVVPSGFLQFSLETEGWPFREKRNSLEISLLVYSTRDNDTEIDKDNNRVMIKILGSVNDSFCMQFDPNCTVYTSDSSNATIQPVITDLFKSGSDVPMNVSLRFPNFFRMTYDPIMGIEFFQDWNPIDPAYGNLSNSVVIVFALCAIFLLVFGLVTAYFNWKRQRARKYYLNIVE